MRRLAAVAIIAAAMGSGCSSSSSGGTPSPDAFLVLQRPDIGVLDGIVDGVISIEDDCVLLKGTQGGFSRAVWPAGTAYSPTRKVIVTAGGLELRDGDEIRVGGGFEAALDEYNTEARARLFQLETLTTFTQHCRADDVTQERAAMIASLDPPRTPE